MKWLLYILPLVLLSCGPNHYLKKAERAIAKAKELGAEVSPDTVYTDRTYYIPVYKHDTLIQVQTWHDTIRHETERIKWKVKVNEVEKKIFVEAKCKADTVKIKVPVTVETKIKSGFTAMDLIGLVIIALIAGAVLGKMFWRK